MFDAIIVGAGVIGCSVARYLSAYQVNVLVLEKEVDVCCKTSKANSGLVHAGFDAKPGTLKAEYNRKGSAMMEGVCKELEVDYKPSGALVVAFNQEEIKVLESLREQGIRNQIEGLSILTKEELQRLEPNLSAQTVAGLYAQTAGLVCPFGLTIAFAENANMNGAEFVFEQEVIDIQRIDGKSREEDSGNHSGYRIITQGPDQKRQEYSARVIINCAGVHSDLIHGMVSKVPYKIVARKGEYALLDKEVSSLVSRPIFRVPGPMGKGILVTPTVHGNCMLGPTALEQEVREDEETTEMGMKQVLEGARQTLGEAAGKLTRQVITSFAGVRAHEVGGDFVLGEVEDVPFFINALGIESPGLTAAPAIGKDLAEMAARMLQAPLKTDFIPYRARILQFEGLSEQEKEKLCKIKPEYGNIICRCEMITEGEILDAIHRPLGARSLDGIKRRVRAGSGRCQGGFCSPKIVEILAKECHLKVTEITKNGTGSPILTGMNKERFL